MKETNNCNGKTQNQNPLNTLFKSFFGTREIKLAGFGTCQIWTTPQKKTLERPFRDLSFWQASKSPYLARRSPKQTTLFEENGQDIVCQNLACLRLGVETHDAVVPGELKQQKEYIRPPLLHGVYFFKDRDSRPQGCGRVLDNGGDGKARPPLPTARYALECTS